MIERSASQIAANFSRTQKESERATQIKLADNIGSGQAVSDPDIARFRRALGPFVVAADTTRLAIIFTNALKATNPIIFANDSFLKLTGYDSAEAVGQPFAFLLSRHEDSQPLSRIAVQFTSRTVETIEVRCHRRDHSALLLAIRINPVHDREGKLVQHCISFVDLTAHEERVREEREALHALYQHTPGFIVTTAESDHKFTFANDAFQRLVGERNLLGIQIAEALPEFAEQGFVTLLDQVYRTGQPYTGANLPVRLRGDDSGPHFLDFIFQPVVDHTGTIIGVFCEGHDATEQIESAGQVRLLRAELNELSIANAMGTMAAAIAHELNQPLTAISNYASICNLLIAPSRSTDVGITSAIKGISDGVHRAGEIIRRIRDMTERRRPHHERFDLKDAIREALQLVRAGACEGTIVEYRGAGELTVDGDRVQVEQIIMNLTRNACEAVSERQNGRVIVTAAVERGEAVVRVSDNGPGISSEAEASLFEWTGSTKRSGMGIGLSICRQIVEAHQGRIWLECTSSVGSCIAFALPWKTARPNP